MYKEQMYIINNKTRASLQIRQCFLIKLKLTAGKFHKNVATATSNH